MISVGLFYIKKVDSNVPKCFALTPFMLGFVSHNFTEQLSFLYCFITCSPQWIVSVDYAIHVSSSFQRNFCCALSPTDIHSLLQNNNITNMLPLNWRRHVRESCGHHDGQVCFLWATSVPPTQYPTIANNCPNENDLLTSIVSLYKSG